MWNNGWQPKENDNCKKPPNTGSCVDTPVCRCHTQPPKPNNTSIKEKMMYTYKNNTQVVKIYDITYDTNGYPLFLIYIDGQWIRKSAKYFKPMNNINKL